MNHVARQENTDYESHGSEDIRNASSSDRVKVLNDVVVNDIRPTRTSNLLELEIPPT